MVAWVVKKVSPSLSEPCTDKDQRYTFSPWSFFYWADEYFSLQIFTNIADLIFTLIVKTICKNCIIICCL